MTAVSAQPGEYRALTVFDRLPEGCIAFPVVDALSMPHLRLGEIAVCDGTDREPQHGELFVIEWSSGRQSIMQAAAREHMGVDGKPFTGWWTRNLAASQLSAREKLWAIHCDDSEIASAVMSLCFTDGPRQIDGFRKAIVGRIVGVLAPANAQAA